MCMVCRHSPCLPQCPNVPEPVKIHTCKECGDGIYAGDRFAEIEGSYYCESCLDDMAAETLLSLMGYEMETADANDGGIWDDYE